jgi:23S rRNA pseudouridine2605 synthase
MKLLTYLQQTHWLARRTITDLIQHREIILNGVVVDNFMIQVNQWDQYLITSMGISWTVSISTTKPSHLILFHKPVGYTVSKSDPHNDTIFDILPSDWRRAYYPIGRLDKDSCGLLLLTDNTAWVNQLSHPRYQHDKIYHVLLKQKRNPADKVAMLQWISIDDEQSGEQVVLACDKVEPIIGWVAITLHEGKNRHIRKMLYVLWYDIIELKRISFCGIGLGDLSIGEYHAYQVTNLDAFLLNMAASVVSDRHLFLPQKSPKKAWQGIWNL